MDKLQEYLEFKDHCVDILASYSEEDYDKGITALLDSIYWSPKNLDYLQIWRDNLYDKKFSSRERVNMFTTMYKNNWIRGFRKRVA
jgi:hypothetical protein